MIISFFPKPLKPCAVVSIYFPLFLIPRHISFVARMLSNIPSQIRQEMEFIRPMVEERSARMEEFGDDWDKPVRKLKLFSSSLVTHQNRAEKSLKGLARRLLIVNFSAIHSTAQASVNTFLQTT